MSVQQIEAYGTKKYYEELISNLLAQSKKLTPVAKCVRVLTFRFYGSLAPPASTAFRADSLNNLTVPFDVVRVKAYLIGVVTAGAGADLHTFECSINNGYGIGSVSQASLAVPTITQPVEFIYQQPRSFQNEIVSMQSMSGSTGVYVPSAVNMIITLHLELSSI
jgi:hypothetical protein